MGLSTGGSNSVGAPTGSAGGALAGTYPDPTVLKVGAGSTTVSSFAETLLDDAAASNARTTLAATIVQLETDASITPCADATVTPVTSITTKKGIITAIS